MNRHVTYKEIDSHFGHDAFLIEMSSLEELVCPFLDQTYVEVQKDG